VFNRVNLDEYIPIMLDFTYLRRVISQFSLLISDNTVRNLIHEVFNGTQSEDYWKKHLNKSLSNPCGGIVEGEKEINVIVGTYSEIIELTKGRKKYNLEMNDILQLYTMMSIVLSPVISVNGIRDKGITEVCLSVVDKTFESMIRSFVMSMQRPGKRIMLTSATICSFDHGNLFKAHMQPRKITFGEGGDPLDTNAKMLILADSKRYHAIGRESRYNKEEEIVFKIRTILEIYGDSECMIITISQKEANKLMMALNKAGHSHPVKYYKAPETMGVSAKERVMIAVGVANKPSNAYDVITTNTEDSKVMLHEAVHADTWQAWSRVKDPSGKEESLIFALGCNFEECEALTHWRYDRKVCIQKTPNGYKKQVDVICGNEVITKPEIAKCKSFEEMLKEASIHKQSKNTAINIEKPLMSYNIRGFQKKMSRFLDSRESLLSLVINRTDVHALQQPDGRYFKALLTAIPVLTENTCN